MALVSLTAAAHCQKCDWTAEGEPAATYRAADKHAKAGHPTAYVAVPA